MKWEKVKLGDCCTVTSSKRFHAADRSSFGIPFFCSKEIIQKTNGENVTSCDYITEESYENIKKIYGVPKVGDLLITTRGTYGVPYIYRNDDCFYFADGNLTWLKDFNKKLISLYLYYWIKSYDGQKKIDAIAKGTAQKAVSIAAIKMLDLEIPPLQTQKRIASILSAYDDLIENNQKQIKLLEEAAQRLYKEWFVDLRFPGHENVKVIDGVPEGWEKKKLVEIADLRAGGDKPDSFSQIKNDLCKVPIFSNGVDKEGLFGYTDKAEVEKESITISARGNVGYTCLRRKPYVAIVRLLCVIPVESIITRYLYFYLKNTQFNSNGSAQQQLTIPMIKNIVVVIPERDILLQFDNRIENCFTKVDVLEEQISSLREARDRLLPKLMSGEIEV